MFRGTEVAVKQIVVNDVSSSALEEFELESAVMAYVILITKIKQRSNNLYSGLRHPNIVIFMGACMDPVAKEMFIVMVCPISTHFTYSFILIHFNKGILGKGISA